MKQIPLTQGKFALVDDEDFDFLMQFKWRFCKSINGTGYAVRTTPREFVNGRLKAHSVLMHRQIMSAPKNLEVDHADRDKLNNQKYNLRLCTHAENQRNIGLTSKNTSGYKGVFWSEKDKKWISILMVNGETKRLGYFKKIEDAKIAYDKACIFYHGDFAKPNI